MCRSCRFLSKHESFPSRSRFEEARGRGLDRRSRILSSMCFEYCDYESCNLSNYRSKFRDQRMLHEDSSSFLPSTSTSYREDSSCKNRDKKRPFHSKSSLHSLAHSLTLSDTIWWFSSIGQRIRVCFRDIDACLKPRIRFLEDGFVSDRFQTLCSSKIGRRTSNTRHLDLQRYPCLLLSSDWSMSSTLERVRFSMALWMPIGCWFQCRWKTWIERCAWCRFGTCTARNRSWKRVSVSFVGQSEFAPLPCWPLLSSSNSKSFVAKKLKH